ncbi:hypothetical protein D3C73_719680 [compost metagenome]
MDITVHVLLVKADQAVKANVHHQVDITVHVLLVKDKVDQAAKANVHHQVDITVRVLLVKDKADQAAKANVHHQAVIIVHVLLVKADQAAKVNVRHHQAGTAVNVHPQAKVKVADHKAVKVQLERVRTALLEHLITIAAVKEQEEDLLHKNHELHFARLLLVKN